MKIIKDSPEHHFLTFVDKIKRDSGGWLGVRLAFSEKLEHAKMLEKLEHIPGKLADLRKESEAVIAELKEEVGELTGATVYQFADNDLIFLARPTKDAETTAVKKLYKAKAEKYGEKFCTFSNLAKDVYSYQKLADERFLSSARIKAYQAMADTNRLHSIPLRRQRRDDALILIVEDDRFTASYAANILNKDYDIVLAKTGEEAVISYIEHAPDAVLLDIHLPGLNGHETLQALRKIDKESFIIMLSVDTAKQNIVSATKIGAAAFLKKPFSKDRLLHTLKQSPFVRKAQS